MVDVATETASFTLVIDSRSPHETKMWGRRLASVLEGGELLGLIGDLGSGNELAFAGQDPRLEHRHLLARLFPVMETTGGANGGTLRGDHAGAGSSAVVGVKGRCEPPLRKLRFGSRSAFGCSLTPPPVVLSREEEGAGAVPARNPRGFTWQTRTG